LKLIGGRVMAEVAGGRRFQVTVDVELPDEDDRFASTEGSALKTVLPPSWRTELL
jgi:hypothetical protein